MTANHPISLEMVATDRLTVDPTYQRTISDRGRRVIRKMETDFQWSRFGALCVAKHGDTLQVTDGQHRLIAARNIGIQSLPCVITTAETAEQAGDFVGINIDRTTVSPTDKFRARVVAGDPDALTLHRILTDLDIGTNVAPGISLGPRQTRSISLLQRLITTHGEGTVFTALEALCDAQPDASGILTSAMIGATAWVVDTLIESGHSLDRLVSVLETIDPETMAINAASIQKVMGGQNIQHTATLILKAYNKGLHNPATLGPKPSKTTKARK